MVVQSVVSVDLVGAAKRSESRPKEMADDVLDQTQERYEKFLCLIAKHPDAAVAPTKDIDFMWHLHMLHPRQYVADCQALFGDILDHDGGFGADASELPELERVFANTAKLWRMEYGEDYVDTAEYGMVKCTRNCVSRCKRACKTK